MFSYRPVEVFHTPVRRPIEACLPPPFMVRAGGLMTSMSRYCVELQDDGTRCRRCGSRALIFGWVDLASLWEGYCLCCNVEWYNWRLEFSCRASNRKRAIHCLRGIVPAPETPVILILEFVLGRSCPQKTEMAMSILAYSRFYNYPGRYVQWIGT